MIWATASATVASPYSSRQMSVLTSYGGCAIFNIVPVPTRLKHICFNVMHFLFFQTLSPVSVFTSGSGVAMDFIGILPAFFRVIYTSFSQPSRLPHALYACLFNRGKGMSTVFGLLSAAAVSVLVSKCVCMLCVCICRVVWFGVCCVQEICTLVNNVSICILYMLYVRMNTNVFPLICGVCVFFTSCRRI